MLPYVLLVLAIIVGGVFLLRWFMAAEPRDIIKAIRISALILGGLFIVYVVLARRWAYLPLLLFIGLPLLARLRINRTMARNAAGPSAGQSSEVDTDYLSMALDHDSGELTGKVLKGSFQGRQVEEMELRELIDLLVECAGDDVPSVSVLEAYLDRRFGIEWRDAAEMTQGPSAEAGAMTQDEAFDILGLEPGASVEDIEQAYRRIMQKLHPDHGGSDYLAAKLNQAKELLLGG